MTMQINYYTGNIWKGIYLCAQFNTITLIYQVEYTQAQNQVCTCATHVCICFTEACMRPVTDVQLRNFGTCRNHLPRKQLTCRSKLPRKKMTCQAGAPPVIAAILSVLLKKCWA